MLSTIGTIIGVVFWTSMFVVTVIVLSSDPTDYPFEF